MFLENAWYVAAESPELDRGLVARTILNQPVVLYRTNNGTPVALEDRCPHRLVPLSVGTIQGDLLRCAYHGAEFRPDGTCARIPGQVTVPNSVCVRSYPVLERYGFLWIWMGDPELSSDEGTIPTGFWPGSDPNWVGCYGRFDSLQVDYRLWNDNVIDITHAEFVHPDSFGGLEAHFFRNAHRGTEIVDRGMSFNIDDRSLHFRFAAKDISIKEAAPIWWHMIRASRGSPTFSGNVCFVVDVDWWAPCYASFALSVRPADEPSARMARICNLHAGTPESETSTNYFYRTLQDYGSPADVPAIAAVAHAIFSQDKPVLEAQQRRVGAMDLLDHKTVSFSGDRLPFEARKILRRLIDAQFPQQPKAVPVPLNTTKGAGTT